MGHPNQGSLESFEEETGKKAAPFGVNLIVHPTNIRVKADLDICVKHKVLFPQAPIKYAKGKLDTGPILQHYIHYATMQLKHPTKRGLDNVLAAALI